MIDAAVAAVVVGAVFAIGYVLYKQRADHKDILQLIDERELKREEYRQ